MKSKKIQTWIYGLGLLFVFSAVACEDDIDPLVEEIAYERALTPVGLTARVSNVTTVTLRWTHVYHAEKYSVELHADSMKFENPVGTYETAASPLVIPDLNGDTQFSVRLKAIGDSTVNDSKWSEVAFRTEIDNILEDFGDSDVWGDQVTFRWPADKSVTSIELTPDEGEMISHEFTETEKTEGKATVSGLTAATKYNVIMYNGTQRVGITSFTTLASGTIILTPENDLAAEVSNASEGAILMLMPGEYSMGEVKITNSIIIQGRNANNKPVIKGRLKCDKDVSSIVLSDVIMDGSPVGDDQSSFSDNVFEFAAAITVGTLDFKNCVIRNYRKHLIYNNKKAKVTEINISGCIIDNIQGDGGDGIDYRGGELGTLKVENTTFSNGFRAFLRMQTKTDVFFYNCTFYKICCMDNSNNTGLFRCSAEGTLTVEKCLFVEIGLEAPGNENSGCWSKMGNMKATASYSDNFYYNCPNLWVGEYTEAPQGVSESTDPGFADATQGDFTISNGDLMDKGIGDPRWIK